MPERDRSAGEIGAAGETVQHGREGALSCLFFENTCGVVVGLARMDDQRQSGLARGGDMSTKTPFLRLARRTVVVVVESRFTQRHDFGPARARDQIGRAHVKLLMSVMRM